MNNDIIKWSDPGMYERPDEDALKGISVRILSATPDPFGTMTAASSLYEGRVVRHWSELSREDRIRGWENAVKTFPQTPREFVSLHFLIEGLGRDITHQMVRQRTARFVQESLRFSVVDDLEVPYPPSLGPLTKPTFGPNGTVEQKKVWQETVARIRWAYTWLVNNGMPAEDARKLLPMGTPTRIHWQSDLRNLAGQAGSRLCTQAQFEWREIWARMLASLRGHCTCPTQTGERHHPTCDNWQWNMIAESVLFRPVCYARGSCPFGTDYDRTCSIRPRVQAGEWDQINMAEWLLDPDAAKPAKEG